MQSIGSIKILINTEHRASSREIELLTKELLEKFDKGLQKKADLPLTANLVKVERGCIIGTFELVLSGIVFTILNYKKVKENVQEIVKDIDIIENKIRGSYHKICLYNLNLLNDEQIEQIIREIHPELFEDKVETIQLRLEE